MPERLNPPPLLRSQTTIERGHLSSPGGFPLAWAASDRGARDVAAGTSEGADRLDRGILLQGADGTSRVVSGDVLARTFGAVGTSVKLVVLNACYSEAQADALLAHVDCVVGMSGAIGDDAARSFAAGFYGGLGARQSIAAAYHQGRAAMGLEGRAGSELPQLWVRAGTHADDLVLADLS